MIFWKWVAKMPFEMRQEVGNWTLHLQAGVWYLMGGGSTLQFPLQRFGYHQTLPRCTKNLLWKTELFQVLSLCKVVMERGVFLYLYVAKSKMLQSGIMGADNCTSHITTTTPRWYLNLVPTKSGGTKNTCYQVRKAGRVRPEMIKWKSESFADHSKEALTLKVALSKGKCF